MAQAKLGFSRVLMVQEKICGRTGDCNGTGWWLVYMGRKLSLKLPLEHGIIRAKRSNAAKGPARVRVFGPKPDLQF